MARWQEEMGFTKNGIRLREDHLMRPGSPKALLKALELFLCEEDALRKHFEEIANERQRQREEAARQDVV